MSTRPAAVCIRSRYVQPRLPCHSWRSVPSLSNQKLNAGEHGEFLHPTRRVHKLMANEGVVIDTDFRRYDQFWYVACCRASNIGIPPLLSCARLLALTADPTTLTAASGNPDCAHRSSQQLPTSGVPSLARLQMVEIIGASGL